MPISNRLDHQRPNPWLRNLSVKTAAVPMIATALVVFIGCSLWTVFYSFTGSRTLPRETLVGLKQYDRLFGSNRWLESIENVAIFGVCTLIFSLTIGFLLAVFMDQKIRFEYTFRTIFLYPFALSFIVTGLVWQWILNPHLGIAKVIRDLGFENFEMTILSSRKMPSTRLSLPGCGKGRVCSWR